MGRYHHRGPARGRGRAGHRGRLAPARACASSKPTASGTFTAWASAACSAGRPLDFGNSGDRRARCSGAAWRPMILPAVLLAARRLTGGRCSACSMRWRHRGAWSRTATAGLPLTLRGPRFAAADRPRDAGALRADQIGAAAGGPAASRAPAHHRAGRDPRPSPKSCWPILAPIHGHARRGRRVDHRADRPAG